jgi:hypothetical protein
MKSNWTILFSLQLLMAQISPAAVASEKTVLVRADSTSASDYLTVIEADHNFESFADYWAQGAENQNLRSELRHAFARAQEKFLQSEMSEMRSEWELVAGYALKSDWSKTYRKLIQTAQMRRAQMSTNDAEAQKWLTDILVLDPTFEPNKSLFPPPLVETYYRLRTHIHRTPINIDAASGFDILLINGVEFNLEKTKKILRPEGTVRATYVSNRYSPVTRILSTRDLNRFRPEKNLFVTGTCATPALSSNSGFDSNAVNVALMFDKNCVISVQAPKPMAASDLNVISQTSIRYSDPVSIESRFDSKANASPFYKKPWFWIGATIVAGGLFAVAQAHQSSSAPATRTEGF